MLKSSPQTVEKYLTLGCVPVHGNVGNLRRSHLDRYKSLIEEEVIKERVNIQRLYRTLQQNGFTRIYKTVRAYVLSRYPQVDSKRQRDSTRGTPMMLFKPLTLHSVFWVLVRFNQEKSADDLRILETIQEEFPVLWEARELLRVALDHIRKRKLEGFLAWVDTVTAGPHQAYQRFVRWMKRDWEAVLNCFKYPYSNGPVEGHVNRIKCIKRQMYGRAKFDLLRLKVLYRP